MQWTDQKQYDQHDVLLDNVSCAVAGENVWFEVEQVWYIEDGKEITKFRLSMGTLFGSQSALFNDLRSLLVTWQAMKKAKKSELPVDLVKLASSLGYKGVVLEGRMKERAKT